MLPYICVKTDLGDSVSHFPRPRAERNRVGHVVLRMRVVRYRYRYRWRVDSKAYEGFLFCVDGTREKRRMRMAAMNLWPYLFGALALKKDGGYSREMDGWLEGVKGECWEGGRGDLTSV